MRILKGARLVLLFPLFAICFFFYFVFSMAISFLSLLMGYGGK